MIELGERVRPGEVWLWKAHVDYVIIIVSDDGDYCHYTRHSLLYGTERCHGWAARWAWQAMATQLT